MNLVKTNKERKQISKLHKMAKKVGGAQIPSLPDGANTAGASLVTRHFEEGLRTSDIGLRKSSVVRSPMSFVKP